MKTITIALCVLALALFAGCNKAGKTTVEAQTKTPAVKLADAKPDTATPTESDYLALAGTKLSLAGGEEVEIISVGKFDSDLQSLDGVVALEGRVAEVFADKGRMVLVDTDRTKDCSDGCCPQTQVPVRLALDNYEGTMPLVETEVIVVGDLTITKLGYEFAVQEIRQGGEVLIQSSDETV